MLLTDGRPRAFWAVHGRGIQPGKDGIEWVKVAQCTTVMSDINPKLHHGYPLCKVRFRDNLGSDEGTEKVESLNDNPEVSGWKSISSGDSFLRTSFATVTICYCLLLQHFLHAFSSSFLSNLAQEILAIQYLKSSDVPEGSPGVQPRGGDSI